MELCSGEFIVQTAVHIFGVGNVIIHARIKQVHSAVFFDSAARKTAVLVVRLCGEKRYIKVLPVRQVAAHGVTPVHSSPPRGVGKMLIEKMVFAVVVYESIGVVYPAPGRFKV